jgi:phage terminase small subunit
MKKRLTKKQRGFVKDYIDTDNATEAVVNNYNVKDRIVAKSIGTENLTKPYIIEEVNRVRRTIGEGLADELLIEKHLALLNKQDDRGIDVQAVSKGLDMAYKIKDSYAAEKHLNVNVEVEANPEIKELADKLNELYGGTSK